jgi:hypothetical protein
MAIESKNQQEWLVDEIHFVSLYLGHASHWPTYASILAKGICHWAGSCQAEICRISFVPGTAPTFKLQMVRMFTAVADLSRWSSEMGRPSRD